VEAQAFALTGRTRGYSLTEGILVSPKAAALDEAPVREGTWRWSTWCSAGMLVAAPPKPSRQRTPEVDLHARGAVDNTGTGKPRAAKRSIDASWTRAGLDLARPEASAEVACQGVAVKPKLEGCRQANLHPMIREAHTEGNLGGGGSGSAVGNRAACRVLES